MLITPNEIDATDPRAQRTAAGIIGEMMRAQALGLRGHVTVELVDDHTGRVVERLDSKNYVNTAQWEAFAEALQKLVWTYGYAGDSSTVTVNPYTNRDPRIIPTLRNDHVACWADTTAENSADIYAFGEIVAWAHRWSQGSPSTRQGIVQPTLCTLSVNAVKWVWEWATSNGNGTFQSVGWRRLGVSSNSGDAVVRDMPHVSRRASSLAGISGDVSAGSSTAGSWTSGPAFLVGGATYYDSGSGKLYTLPLAGGVVVKLCSVPITIDANGDYTLGATTDESAAAFAAGVGGDNIAIATRWMQGLTRLGASGDWIAVGYTGSTTGRRPTIRRVTNAGSISYTNANAGTYSVESGFHDVTYDGSNLWVVATNGNTGVPAIHRIDPATGTISATITAIAAIPAYFPSPSVSRGFSAIEWDADSSWLWVQTTDGYIFNIDTSGNWLGVLFFDTTNEFPISAATLSGQHNAQRGKSLDMHDTDDALLTMGVAGTAVDANSQTWPHHQSERQGWTNGTPGSNPSFRQKLFTMDGDTWAVGQYSAWSSGSPAGSSRHNFFAFTQYPHFASRTLLASPATKNSSQTMRIAYTMTFT